MPSIKSVRDFVIESEEDIPEKYREEVKRRIKDTKKDTKYQATIITSGKIGERISDINMIRDVFSDSQNWYFGHGIGDSANGDEIIESILRVGLNCKNQESVRGYDSHLRGLDSTTVLFGQGDSSLFDRKLEELDHWKHKNSKKIVIISIPESYILNKQLVGDVDFYEPFYVGSEEDGFKVRPEFISGVYDANTRSFIPNDNYYQKLEQKQQNQLFEDVKKNYMKSFAKYSKVFPNDVKEMLPFNESELDELNIEWYQEQIERSQREKEQEEKTFTLNDIQAAVNNSIEATEEVWSPNDDWR